ncbi:hypothetical protein PVNG_05874 [Plasmodium vivax North Korean]|uniref:PIR Superfamily Protein n=1 Tax=Plasmodium vivax North Korean TaxID=1035514 RepID=A0A0J9TLV1_PLAVI|nr:hypothetical protein PVNG_05874 [Plasmodium vivax North Korean]
MLVTKKDDFFEELEDKYPFLWGFPLSNIYELFILSAKTEKSFQAHCNDLSKSDSTCDLRHICTSVATLLLRLKDKFEQGERVSTFDKQCEYLNYWIYYNIKDSLECNNISKFYERIKGIKPSLTPSGHTCDIHDFKIAKEEFLTKKTLFFHSEILDWIKTGYIVNDQEKDDYNKYLEEIFNIYKEIICKADSMLKENCSKELTKFREIFNETLDSLKRKNISITQADIPLQNELLCPTKSLRNQGEFSQAGSELPGTPDLVSAASLTDQSTSDQNFNRNLPEEARPNKGGTIASSLAGSCFFLGMMYKVKKKNIFYKYNHL